jgi:hypothetical protein
MLESQVMVSRERATGGSVAVELSPTRVVTRLGQCCHQVVLLPRLVTCCNEYFVTQVLFRVSSKLVNVSVFETTFFFKSSVSFKMTPNVLRAAEERGFRCQVEECA